jgi:hypothetical protein
VSKRLLSITHENISDMMTETESHRHFSTPGETAEGHTSSNNEGSTLRITKHIASYFSLLREEKKKFFIEEPAADLQNPRSVNQDESFNADRKSNLKKTNQNY